VNKLSGRGVSLSLLFVLFGVSTQSRAQWISFDDQTATRLSLSSVPESDSEEKDITTADLDRDGDLDIIVVRKRPFSFAGARSDLLLMNEGGTLVDRTVAMGFDAGPSDARDVICVDVDNDGWLDVVICTTFEDPIRLYMNLGDDGNGNWLGLNDESGARLGTIFESSRRYCAVGAGDVNGDDAIDLFFSNYDGGDDLLYINDGIGNFTDQTQSRMGTYANSGFGTSNAVVDIDGDGDMDIIKLTTLFSVPPFGRGVYLLWNNGSGVFNTVPFQEIDAPEPYMFVLEDFNNDGMLDMYVVSDNADLLYTTTGVQPDTLWSLSASIPSSPRTGGFGGNLRTGDLDNDGDMDLAVGPIDTDLGNCGGSGRMALLRNENGVLSDPYASNNGQNFTIQPHDLVYLDLNEDGCLDIFMGLCTGYKVFIRSDCDAQVPCNAADFSEPFGQLDFFDVSFFLNNLPNMDPDPQFNFFDISIFLNLMADGCP
jgi:FG-GAP-like repeat